MEAYFDHAATTGMLPEVVETVRRAMEDLYGNTSSLHRVGTTAADALEEARRTLAATLHATPGEVVMNSGATEGNNQVIRSFIKPGAHFITSKVEHPSVLRSMEMAQAQGVRVDFLDVHRDGVLDLDALAAAVTKNTDLVSIMMVNNETGAVNPLAEIRRILTAKSRKAKLHVDAVQGFLKLPLDVGQLGLDFLTASAHKVHGPKGVGLLYVRKGLRLQPLLYGGGHEFQMRAGTVNTPGILGFAKAAELLAPRTAAHFETVAERKAALMDRLGDVEGLQFTGGGPEESPYILSLSLPGLRGEVLLHYLSAKGVHVSTGSACSSRNAKDSHVLTALGLDPAQIKGSIRMSLSPFTTTEEVAHAAKIIKEAVGFLRRK